MRGFLFFHFGFGCRTDADYRHSTHQLGQALLELFAVIVGSCFLDLRPKLFNPSLDVDLFAGAFHDSGGVLVDL
jgi:hypothetical protein